MTVLRCQDLTIGYRRAGARHIVASGVNTEIEAGILVGLVGPNGAGKSTLLRTIAGLQPVLAGRVELLGMELSKVPRTRLARELAVVLTDAVDPGRLRVDEVVGLGRHPYTGWSGALGPEDRRIVAEALAAVDISSLAAHMMWELSDGQRQRVMIARALAQQPSVLLLDEPTAFLDPPGRIRVFEVLMELAHNRRLAVIVSTHDVEVAARHVDQLWLLDQDAAVIVGEPALLAGNGAVAAAFGGDVDFDPTNFLFVSRRRGAGAQ